MAEKRLQQLRLKKMTMRNFFSVQITYYKRHEKRIAIKNYKEETNLNVVNANIFFFKKI